MAVVVWRTRRGTGEGTRAALARFRREVVPWRLVAFVALIIAYMLALEPLGFLASSAAFLVVALLLLWRRNVLAVLAVACGSLAVVYALFHWLFRVVLP
jgi:putative tricarboxylic transport membrane protein